jgi:hypothetical protein
LDTKCSTTASTTPPIRSRPRRRNRRSIETSLPHFASAEPHLTADRC